MISLSQLFAISRPRFWIYLVGPYALGTIAGTPDTGALAGAWTLFWLVGFTLPFNLFIYGVNDVADHDTDALNPKKQGYERGLARKEHHAVLLLIGLTCLPWLVAAFWLGMLPLAFLLVFLVLGAGYSLPPLRFKARPFLDSLSNVLYAVPGFFAYALSSEGNAPSGAVLVACTAWCAAMHAYSAIPDIASDRAARIATIATTLGKQGTTIFCAALWLLAGTLTYPLLGPGVLLGALVYLGMCLGYLRATTHEQLMGWYRTFPLVNTTIGALLTVGLLWVRL